MRAMNIRWSVILPWVTMLVGCFIVTAVAFVYFKVATGSFIPAILPEIQADLLYYLTQAKEVLDGYPMLGNPYIIEHVNDRFFGLLLPIWLTAIPGVFGVSINGVYAINAFLYSLLLGCFLFIFCKKVLHDKPWLAACITILGVASLHNLMIRPAIMQTVYPAFALFTVTLLGVLERPQNMIRYILLGIVTAFTFYLYPFLWMITFTAIGLLTIAAALKGDRTMLRYLVIMEVIIVALCVPQILNSIALFTNESAHELHYRVGLMETHLIHPWAILFAKYTFIIVGGLLLLKTQRKLQTPEILLLLLASSLLIATFSNGITGKEMNFDTHFWRIGMFVNIVAIPVLITSIQGSRTQHIIASVCLAAVLLTTVNRVAIRGGGFVYLRGQESSRNYHKSIQSYKEVFRFFNENKIINSVVMAPDILSSYIPLYTKNYIFFVGPAKYHSIPNEELLERFLIKNIDRINKEYLIQNIIVYTGWKAEREAFTANAYGGNMQPIDWLGGDVFINSTLQQSTTIDKEYEKSLKQFTVDYVVIDRLSQNNPRLPIGSTVVFQTERFTIYKII